MEKELFDLVEHKGECLEGKFHIIDISDYSYDETIFDNAVKYRIYHEEGYCFNIERYEIINFEEFEYSHSKEENIDGFYYYFISDLFEGYKELNLKKAVELIKKYK